MYRPLTPLQPIRPNPAEGLGRHPCWRPLEGWKGGGRSGTRPPHGPAICSQENTNKSRPTELVFNNGLKAYCLYIENGFIDFAWLAWTEVATVVDGFGWHQAEGWGLGNAGAGSSHELINNVNVGFCVQTWPLSGAFIARCGLGRRRASVFMSATEKGLWEKGLICEKNRCEPENGYFCDKIDKHFEFIMLDICIRCRGLKRQYGLGNTGLFAYADGPWKKVYGVSLSNTDTWAIWSPEQSWRRDRVAHYKLTSINGSLKPLVCHKSINNALDHRIDSMAMRRGVPCSHHCLLDLRLPEPHGLSPTRFFAQPWVSSWLEAVPR
jgi:hypothetical protein